MNTLGCFPNALPYISWQTGADECVGAPGPRDHYPFAIDHARHPLGRLAVGRDEGLQAFLLNREAQEMTHFPVAQQRDHHDEQRRPRHGAGQQPGHLRLARFNRLPVDIEHRVAGKRRSPRHTRVHQLLTRAVAYEDISVEPVTYASGPAIE
ncbi:hypothetical protein [Azospirillum sp.]|uniref:hypothetical protein n=1 Tax=Azospirillum sp. TaxID=34012 RepID=UPI003D73B73C